MNPFTTGCWRQWKTVSNILQHAFQYHLLKTFHKTAELGFKMHICLIVMSIKGFKSSANRSITFSYDFSNIYLFKLYSSAAGLQLVLFLHMFLYTFLAFLPIWDSREKNMLFMISRQAMASLVTHATGRMKLKWVFCLCCLTSLRSALALSASAH